jgi:DNA-binding HxlR family transcriptional regulator
MPAKTDLARLNCSLARALNVVGDWWTLLIVRDAALGVRRFSEFRESLGLARNILADRLQRLVEAGVLRREGPDARPTYALTEKGRALLPALAALMQWGDAWASSDGAPVEIVDDAGRAIAPVGLYGVEGPLGPDQVRFQAGPGADPKTRAFLTRMAAKARCDQSESIDR